ncbi:MAG TPA: leucine-rich repeat domain-containing protein [Candidatus Saccharimonadales bacterium]|nr:leucine-rich repeat domain-containing protein [Candidatus Saccharimonadales bacterium]
MNKLLIIVVGILVIAAGIVGYSLRGSDDVTSTSTDGTSNTSSSSSKTADYSGKGLSEFPKDVLKDKKITVLDLSDNNLTGAIPAEIHDLANLVRLDLSDNQMTGIPAEVGQLRKLKVLDYSNNQITGLPMELGNLTQLEVLDLSGNNVSQQDLAGIRSKLLNTEIKL